VVVMKEVMFLLLLVCLSIYRINQNVLVRFSLKVGTEVRNGPKTN